MREKERATQGENNIERERLAGEKGVGAYGEFGFIYFYI